MVHHEVMESPRSAPARDRFTAVAGGAAVVVALAGSAVATAYDRADSGVFADTLSFAFAVGAVVVVGAVVALAVPGNRVGWLLLAAAAVMGAGAALTEAGVHGVVTAPGSVPGAAYMAAIGPSLEAAGVLIPLGALPGVFPGRPPPRPPGRRLARGAAPARTLPFPRHRAHPHTQRAPPPPRAH